MKAITMARQASTFAVYEQRNSRGRRRFTTDADQPDPALLQQLAARMDRVEQVILSIINGTYSDDGTDPDDDGTTDDDAGPTNLNDTRILNHQSFGANIQQPRPGDVARNAAPRPVLRTTGDDNNSIGQGNVDYAESPDIDGPGPDNQLVQVQPMYNPNRSNPNINQTGSTNNRLDQGTFSNGLDKLAAFNTTDQQKLYRRIERSTAKVIGVIQAKNEAAYRRK
jgi:hypothetical protein